jgi:Anti-sigma-K factor rskA/Putative zinc-finger
MPTVTHAEASELLAAYALDAVTEQERVEVEDHLRSCRACADELARHREAAGFIAQGELPSPSGQWDRIEAAISEPAPVTSLADRRRSRTVWTAVVAASVSAAAAALLTFVVVDPDGGDDGSLEAAARAAAEEPGAQEVQLEAFRGGDVMEAVVLPDGTAYVFDSSLAELPVGSTYQLWALDGEDPVSLGLLGRDPGARQLEVPPGTKGLAITEELAAGAVAPTGTPVASADLA